VSKKKEKKSHTSLFVLVAANGGKQGRNKDTIVARGEGQNLKVSDGVNSRRRTVSQKCHMVAVWSLVWTFPKFWSRAYIFV
jgi:hypothetical protein